MERRKRKAINFDLDTNEMKSLGIYPDGYRQLGKSFHKWGFDHRQGSGYVSKNKLSNSEVIDAMLNVTEENLWIARCSKTVDLSDVGPLHDLTALVKNYASMVLARESAKDSNDSSKKELSSKDEQVISSIANSKFGAEFCDLYKGKNIGEGDAADKKLIGIIHFFAEDAAQSERIFKSSELYRADKGAGYIQGLIKAAKNAPVAQGDKGRGKTQYKGSAR